MTEAVDQPARDLARKALAKHAAHEGLCAERWESARREMKNNRIILWWLITAVVVGQGSVILLLAQKALAS